VRAECERVLLLLALHSACCFAPRQEQSRYSASAAHAKSLAGRSAPCIADHQCYWNSWQARSFRQFWPTVFSKVFSLLLLGSNSPLVISLWLCRNCLDSPHPPPRVWLAHGAEMYFAAQPLLAVQFTPKGAFTARPQYGGLSDA